MTLRESEVWIWWPADEGEEKPEGLASVPFGWIDRSGRPLAAPESPAAAVDFCDDVVTFATEWFEQKANHGDVWESVPGRGKNGDDFTRVHVQFVAGGPVIQVSISCEWSPSFRGSILGYEDRRQNEEDPRRAYTAVREAAKAAEPDPNDPREVLRALVRSNLGGSSQSEAAKEHDVACVMGGVIALEHACLPRAHGTLTHCTHWHHLLTKRDGLTYVIPTTPAAEAIEAVAAQPTDAGGLEPRETWLGRVMGGVARSLVGGRGDKA